MNKFIKFEKDVVVEVSSEKKEGFFRVRDVEKCGTPKKGDPKAFYVDFDGSSYVRQTGTDLWDMDEREIPLNLKKVDGFYVEKTLKEQYDCGFLSEIDYKYQRIEEIKNELYELDEKTTRPLRAILAGIGTEEDKRFLTDIENKAKSLRDELKALSV